jgi:hypothetical protein
MVRTPLDEGKAAPPRSPAAEGSRPDWMGPPTLLAPPENQAAPPKEAGKEGPRRPPRVEPKFDLKQEPKPEPQPTPKAEPVIEARGARKASETRAEAAEEVPAPPPPARPRRRRELEDEPPPREPAALPEPPGDDVALEEAVAEPEFLREGSPERRSFSVIYGGGSALLAIFLVIQLAVIFRTEITTRWPQWRPTLVQVCGLFGCNVGWPTRAELLAVVGTELQSIPGTDVLELTAVIRNRASFKVALPAIEITLTDTTNRTLARKVFAPVDYLASAGEPSSRIDDGLGPGSDYTIRVAFEARGVAAAGFVVYPFYL